MAADRRWTTREGNVDYTLELRSDLIVFTEGGPSHHSQAGTSFRHDQFRDGWFHSEIERHFGSAVLRSILGIINGDPDDPFLGADTRIRTVLTSWSLIEIDAALTALSDEPESRGSERSVSHDGYTLTSKRHQLVISHSDHEPVTIGQWDDERRLLAHHDRFLVAAGGHGFVFDRSGVLIASTKRLARSHGVSFEIVVDGVARSGDDAAFTFAAGRDDNDLPARYLGSCGCFRLSDDGEITARGGTSSRGMSGA